ncbi:MAG: hypothetical protein ACPGVO_03260 [Spirulinaceae cyanobacterium]
MTDIKVEFDDIEVSSLPDSEMIVSCIEGRLLIYINNDVFFDEDHILLVEFAQDLLRWQAKITHGLLMDFRYSSMDYEEEGILSFLKADDIKYWRIYSVWQAFKSDSGIDIQHINRAIDSFISCLRSRILSDFDYDIEKYLN